MGITNVVNRFKIEAETSAMVVGPDGSVFTPADGEAVDGVEIRAEADMLPVPLDDPKRTWGTFTLTGYWVAEAFGISQYQVASSAVSAGLSPAMTIGAVILGHFIISLACAANGYVGARYGINFPSYARTCFGVYGTYLAVVCRSVAAIIWFGTQSYQGGQAVQVMLQAIWPSFINFPNHLPADAHVTSAMLLCFFIFWLIQLPLLHIHISKLHYLFLVKIVVMPIFGIALFGWAVGRAHGFGPVFTKATKITDGRTPGLVFMSAFTSAIAPKATLSLNLADFTRYAKNPRRVIWTNIFSLTVLVTLCAILGVVVTSATEVIYGKATWSPLQVSQLMGRAPKFFTAFCWALAVLSTNISANSTAVGNDLMIMFPKWINIRRGQYITAILGVVTCPWIIQSTAKTFTAFLGGYSVFLAPIGGILMAEFFLVRKRRISLPDLFILNPKSCYYYTRGVNLRGIAAFVLGVVPTLPGMIYNINPNVGVPHGAVYVYAGVYPVGCTVAALVYTLLSYAFPPAPLPSSYSASNYSFDGVSDKEKDIGVEGTNVVQV
ncbi:hypothetical protein JCM11251_002522 [Rhodosporidiobolus azoricus]